MQYNGCNFAEVVYRHQEWLKKYTTNDGNIAITREARIDIDRADFSGAQFVSETHFENDAFKGLDLRYALFMQTRMFDKSFSFSNLEGAVFHHSTIVCGRFNCANLVNVDFCDSNLIGAGFDEANLEGADFSRADLRDASFFQTRLKGAKFKDAITNNATFYRAFDVPFMPMACPDTGSFIGWKKAYIYGSDPMKGVIVKLLIPEDAKRSSANGRKCRCSKAVVLEIQDIEGNNLPYADSIVSSYDPSFIYRVGETVVPYSRWHKEDSGFDENRWRECSTGIHFFINRQEAVDYDG